MYKPCRTRVFAQNMSKDTCVIMPIRGQSLSYFIGIILLTAPNLWNSCMKVKIHEMRVHVAVLQLYSKLLRSQNTGQRVWPCTDHTAYQYPVKESCYQYNVVSEIASEPGSIPRFSQLCFEASPMVGLNMEHISWLEKPEYSNKKKMKIKSLFEEQAFLTYTTAFPGVHVHTYTQQHFLMYMYIHVHIRVHVYVYVHEWHNCTRQQPPCA